MARSMKASAQDTDQRQEDVMFRKKRVTRSALALVAVALIAAMVATTSSGASHGQQTIALVRDSDGFFDPVQKGAEAASTALGDRLIVETADDAATKTSTIKSLIAQHVDAIAVDPQDHPAALKPVLAQAQAAGISTLSFDQPIAGSGSVWVNQTGSTEYAQALAEALAAQTGSKGQYAIVPCRPANPIVQTWLKAIKAYIPTQYPRMKRVAVVYGDDSGGPRETAMFRHLIRTHPHLRGLIALCQTEAFVVPQAIIQARKVGKVFAAGDGQGYCDPVDAQLATYIRRGLEQIVCGGDLAKLGYLTVWAADYLTRGHSFAPGQYDVGGPVGAGGYDATNMELFPLGQPLTITKANIDQYAGG
jgi:rhamnose transport system substrate-binding protein